MRTAAALLGLVSIACSPPPSDSLFPLDAGRRWVYDVKTEWENNVVEHETQELAALGTDHALPDGPAYRRRSGSGVEYWLRSDASGIYRVASKSDLDTEPTRDPAPRFVLKMPLAVGTQWQAATTAYLLKRRQEFPREIRHSHPAVPMHYTIEAVGQTLDTRVGRFSGCARVKGVAALRLFADPVVGWRDMALTTTEWYCPGVGLVRVVREEPAQSTFLAGGTLTMDLISWQ